MTGLSPDIYLLAEQLSEPVNSIQLSMTDANDLMSARNGRCGTS